MQERTSTPTMIGGIIGAVGLWLMLSPSVISVSGGAAYSQIITGGGLILLSIASLVVRNGLILMGIGLAGLWLALSVLLFNMPSGAENNLLATAVLVLLLGSIDAFTVRREIFRT